MIVIRYIRSSRLGIIILYYITQLFKETNDSRTPGDQKRQIGVHVVVSNGTKER